VYLLANTGAQVGNKPVATLQANSTQQCTKLIGVTADSGKLPSTSYTRDLLANTGAQVGNKPVATLQANSTQQCTKLIGVTADSDKLPSTSYTSLLLPCKPTPPNNVQN
jgi:hypothetical protein